MNINKHTYEAFIIDALDGTLDDGSYKELMAYLSTDEEAKRQFDLLSASPFTLPSEPVDCKGLVQRIKANRASMSQHETARRANRMLISAAAFAAAALLIFGLFFEFSGASKKDRRSVVAETEKDPSPISPESGLTSFSTNETAFAAGHAASEATEHGNRSEKNYMSSVVGQPVTSSNTAARREPVKREIIDLPPASRIRLDPDGFERIELAEVLSSFPEEALKNPAIQMNYRSMALYERMEKEEKSAGHLIKNLLAPFIESVPITFIEDNETKGIMIASLIKIEKRKQP